MQIPSVREPASKRCPYPAKRIIFPMAILGTIGLFINSRVSLNSFNYCSPKTNIVFLKTHKSAGSTIQNILMRYGDKHNLLFALPNRGNYIGHPYPFKQEFLLHPLFPSYNILAHHTRLNYSAIRKLMPSNTVYITIIRDPVDLFESLYSYYNLEKLDQCNIHQLIRNYKWCRLGIFRAKYSRLVIANQMSFDLGMDLSMFENDSLIQGYLDQLESWFHLVLVAERMDMSLILMRHLLCWDIEDMVAFKLNSRNPKYKSQLSESQKLKVREMSKADVLLYNRFVSKFEAQVNEFGRERMDLETTELRRRTQMWYETCVNRTFANHKVLLFEVRNVNNVNNETCESLTASEITYTDYLKEKQQMNSALQEKRHIKTKFKNLTLSQNLPHFGKFF